MARPKHIIVGGSEFAKQRSREVMLGVPKPRSQKQKMSETWKLLWKNPEFKRRMISARNEARSLEDSMKAIFEEAGYKTFYQNEICDFIAIHPSGETLLVEVKDSDDIVRPKQLTAHKLSKIHILLRATKNGVTHHQGRD